jgi:membrane-associated phospholipid phosphatase
VSLADFDRSLSARVSVASQTPPPQWALALRHISQTGSYGLGWIVAFAAVAAVAGSWKQALIGAACVVGTLMLNTCIKKVVRRPRPQVSVMHAPTTSSMPSAHSAMAVVGAACMSVVLPELTVVWWLWAGVLAVSRVVLGMHYIGDVVVGLLLGAVVATLVAIPLVHAV